MGNGRSTNALNTQQIEQALQILERERQANTPSPRQEKISKLLNIAIYGLAIILLILNPVAGVFLKDFSRGLAWVLGIPTWVLLIGIAVLTVFNLPYMLQVHCQHKRMRELGLSAVLRMPWKTKQREKRWPNILDLGSRLVVLLLLVASLVMLFVLWGIFETTAAAEGTTLWLSLGALILTMAAVLMIVIVTIVATYYTWRSKEQLELVSHLSSSLEWYKKKSEKDKDSRVHIPPKDYDEIAQIERAQILRQRDQSIRSGSDEAGTSYALQKSREAQEAHAKLDATTRLRVQDQIDALMTEPHPTGVTEDPKAGILHMHVPETPITIGFTVDDRARRVQILSVESTGGSFLAACRECVIPAKAGIQRARLDSVSSTE